MGQIPGLRHPEEQRRIPYPPVEADGQECLVAEGHGSGQGATLRLARNARIAVGNCRRQGLDPESYLAEAIRRMPAGATPEEAAALTPSRIAAARAKPAEAEAEVAAVAPLTD